MKDNTGLIDVFLDHHIPLEVWGKDLEKKVAMLHSDIMAEKGALVESESGELIWLSTIIALNIKRPGGKVLMPQELIAAEYSPRPVCDIGFSLYEIINPYCQVNMRLGKMIGRLGIKDDIVFEAECTLVKKRKRECSPRYPGLFEKTSTCVFEWNMQDGFFRHQYSERTTNGTIIYKWVEENPVVSE